VKVASAEICIYILYCTVSQRLAPWMQLLFLAWVILHAVHRWQVDKAMRGVIGIIILTPPCKIRHIYSVWLTGRGVVIAVKRECVQTISGGELAVGEKVRYQFPHRARFFIGASTAVKVLISACLLYCTVLNCTVLNCTVLYCTALHCTVSERRGRRRGSRKEVEEESRVIPSFQYIGSHPC
jgi:hypothetical protein